MTMEILKGMIQLVIWGITIGGLVWKASSMASKIKQNEQEIKELKVQFEAMNVKYDGLRDAISDIRNSLVAITTKLDYIIGEKKVK